MILQGTGQSLYQMFKLPKGFGFSGFPEYERNGDRLRTMKQEYVVGIDAGSVSVNCMVLNARKEVLFEHPYRRHFGQVQKTVAEIVEEVRHRFGNDSLKKIIFTGNYGKLLAERFKGDSVLESIAQIVGTIFMVPDCQSILSMGGQDTAVYQIVHQDGMWELKSFNTNGPCATGTGSFLDQQAQRLATSLYAEQKSNQKIEDILQDFIALGMKSQSPAHVACRCTVFTKSDMIHLQNKGEPLENVIYGLHAGNARNYISTIINNRVLEEPIVFIGGLTLNELQLKSLREYYPNISVPDYTASIGALGAALHFLDEGDIQGQQTAAHNKQNVGGHLFSDQHEIQRTSPLVLEQSVFPDDNDVEHHALEETREVIVGIDVGSTTTKSAVILQDNSEIIYKKYLPTQGKPIQVTKVLLDEIQQKFGRGIRISGVATTGSGRYVVGDFLNADLIIDEITAHAKGAVSRNAAIDTIFEIGGQDSKYISLQNTYPLDFDMNKVCSAGTGSFLHELANKFDINIVNEFQHVALSSSSPVKLSERCTVFMESDLVAYDQMDIPQQDLMAGLCYAIVANYLNRVVGKRHIGKNIMFLGGPSLNKAVVAAFESTLGVEILVPKHREVMGAYGAAISLQEKIEQAPLQSGTGFRGIEQVLEDQMDYSEIICRADPDCHNRCKLKVYNFGGKKSIWGGECGRYETIQNVSKKTENRFELWHQIWDKHLAGLRTTLSGDDSQLESEEQRPSIGMPRALFTYHTAVFWASLFHDLGFHVVLSPKTNTGIVQDGIENVLAETCFPIKVAHGHVKALIKATDHLFLPTMINMATPRPEESGFYCPLVQSFQYIVRQALEIDSEFLVNPIVHMKLAREKLAAELFPQVAAKLRIRKRDFRKALDCALDRHESFIQEVQEAGAARFGSCRSNEEPLILVTGRPYNLYDERVNLRLGQNLSKLGIQALPMDFLDTSAIDLSDFPSMYWGLGAQILRMARFIKNQTHCYGLHISNFSCGADSFLEHFYKYIMGDKPYLLLELDEHSSASGIMTRLEAFKNVVETYHSKQKKLYDQDEYFN